MNATDGLPQQPPFAWLDPSTSFWKMSQASLLPTEDGTGADASPIWPRSGSMLDGRCYELRMPAPPTAGSGSGSSPGWPTATAADAHGAVVYGRGNKGLAAEVRWPTPRANDGEKRGDFDATNPRNGLAGAARIDWPTPDAGAFNDGESLETWQARRDRHKARKINGNGCALPLAIAVQLPSAENRWPTPRATDWKDGRRGNDFRHGRSLPEEAKRDWPTPTCSDATGGQCPAEKVPASRQGSLGLKELKKGLLSPRWVCALMGWPLDFFQGITLPKKGKKGGD